MAETSHGMTPTFSCHNLYHPPFKSQCINGGLKLYLFLKAHVCTCVEKHFWAQPCRITLKGMQATCLANKRLEHWNVWCSKGRFQPFKASNVISTMCQVSVVFKNGPHTASEESKHNLKKNVITMWLVTRKKVLEICPCFVFSVYITPRNWQCW